ncbi:MAG TPA: hypothetical protein VFW98_15580 [Gemmatimonadaceae bacterium]|nr:hypothetical protein [Gemmatimonadaceae bacterium]
MPSRRTPLRPLLAALLILGLPGAAMAQATVGLGDDATTLPGGALRFSVANLWTRFDSRFDSTGAQQSLGAALTSDAAGVAQFENLAPLQRDVRSLSGLSSFTVDIGRTAVFANARVRTTPISLELGLTHWLQIGVRVPIVSTRTGVALRTNQAGPAGNVGVNPGLTSGSPAAAANALLLQQFASADSALNGQIASCTAAPTGANCGAVLAAGPALLAQAQDVAAGLSRVYGGSFFVPRTGSMADTAIRARIAGLGARFDSLGISAITAGGPAGSDTPAGAGDLQRFITDDAFGLAGDSLQSIERTGVGDVELSAKVQWLSTLGQARRLHPPRGVHLRSAITGILRLGTGKPSAPGDFLGVGTGDGQTDVEVRSENDILFGSHFWTSLVGVYGVQLADQRVMRIADPTQPVAAAFRQFPVDRDLGDYVALSVAPRLTLGDYFSIGGQYSYWRKAQDHYTGTFSTTNLAGDTVTLDASILDRQTTQRLQQVSVGIEYSTVAAYAEGRAGFPIEISLVHLVSVAGSGGFAPKTTQDAIRIRLYAHLFGGPMWGRH